MLCYSTGSLPDAFSLPENLSDIADLLAPTPFRGVELVVTPEMLKRAGDVPYWHGVRAGFEDAGLVFRNVHLGAPRLLGPQPHRPGLSSLDPAGRARKAQAASLAASIAALLGSPHVTLTAGLPEDGAESRNQVAAFKEEIEVLIRRKPKDVVFLVEQEPEHVIRSTAQLIELGRAFPGDVFVNFDVGHSQVLGEDIAACVLALGPLLRNVHLEDIKDRVHAHKLYGDGDVDFDAVFRSLRQIGYRWDYTPDLYPFKDDYERAMESSLEFLRGHGILTPAL
jgi:sugar phosphate isomerase/epimerase